MGKFLAENYQAIISIGLLVISIVSSLITYAKTKDRAKLKENVKMACMQFIKEAEQFKNYTGEEKKNYVLTRLKSLTNLFTDTQLSNMIEEFVELTKNVNTKGGWNGRRNWKS